MTPTTDEAMVDRADKLMREFYLSASYDPKAERPADNVKAAIAFTIAALSSSEGSDKWLPIESAPKDGRWILVWLSTGVADTVQWAYGGWWDGALGHVKEERVQLTYWRPLPSPPNEVAK